MYGQILIVMSFLKTPILVVVPVISFVAISFTFLQFTSFMSDFSNEKFNLTYSCNQRKSSLDIDVFAHATQALIIDVALLSIFIIQHSSLLVPIQDVVSTLVGLPVLSRTILNTFTALSLQMLMQYWKPIPQYCLWSIDFEEKSKQQIFTGVHSVCWIIIYVMMITMDITELLGIKQVYYHITGRPTTMLKSEQLKNLHHKMRHPSLLGFTIIFWVYPYMRLDRLVLSVVWSLYMLLAWRPDTLVFNYIVQQQAVKKSVF